MSHVTTLIGAPVDYAKNKESGQFAEHYDLRIPVDPKAADVTPSKEVAGALNAVNLQSDKVGGGRDYQATDDFALLENPHDQSSDYMPIKALNQYSQDWSIKAKITKLGDIRTWKNPRGKG